MPFDRQTTPANGSVLISERGFPSRSAWPAKIDFEYNLRVSTCLHTALGQPRSGKNRIILLSLERRVGQFEAHVTLTVHEKIAWLLELKFLGFKSRPSERIFLIIDIACKQCLH
jgi:hypothetical protein